MFTKTDATSLAPVPGIHVDISTVVAVQPSFRYDLAWLMFFIHSFPYRTCCSYIQSRFHIHSCSYGAAVGTSTSVGKSTTLAPEQASFYIYTL
jgi:hypothetical protein